VGCSRACGEPATDADAATPAHAGNDAWVKKLPREKAFTTIDLPSDAGGRTALFIEWRAHPPRAVKELPRRTTRRPSSWW